MRKRYLNNKGKPIGEKGRRDKLTIDTIRHGMVDAGMDYYEELWPVTNINKSTFFRRLDNLDKFTRGELISIIKALNLSPEDAAKLLGVG